MAKKASAKFYGIGRRKKSIARVYITAGIGNMTINKRDEREAGAVLHRKKREKEG